MSDEKYGAAEFARAMARRLREQTEGVGRRVAGDVVGTAREIPRAMFPMGAALVDELRRSRKEDRPAEMTETPWHAGASSDPGVLLGAAVAGAALPGGGKVPRKQLAKAPKAVMNVFSEVTDPQVARQMALRGAHLKIDPATGKYIGAPEWVTSPGSLTKLRRDALEAVRGGEWNADWYTRQRELAQAIADDPARQSLFARGTAAYSPQAMPKVELPAFLRQYNEAMLTGEQVVPRTGAQARNVAQALRSDPVSPESIRLGKKTGPYAEAKDPTVPEGSLYKTASDIWHGRVMGYGPQFSRGFTPQEHGFLTGENLVLAERAKEAGLPVETPRQAQAATWGSTRLASLGDKEAKQFALQEKLRSQYERDPAKWRAANPGKSPPPKPAPVRTEEELRDFAKQGLDTAAPRQTAFLTEEAIPGRSTGHLAGMIEAPEAVKNRYTREILRSTGRDPTIRGLGLYSRKPIGDMQGEYTNLAGELELNPAWVDPVMVSNVKTPGGLRTPASERQALDIAAKTGAYMRGQEAGAWNRFVPSEMSPSVAGMNAARLEGPTPEELAKLRSANVNVVQAGPTTYHATRFGDAGPIAGTQRDIAGIVPRAERGTLETGYESGITPLEAAGSGKATEELIGTIQASAIRDLPQRMGGWQETARAYNEIDRAIAAERSLPVREDLMRAREIVAKGGIQGLIEHVRKFGSAGLPAALLGALGLEATQRPASEGL